ncbi:OmpH family outer membrane protein [Oceanispirochaeta crateris]|uniref:OmpH family outer membrane protein n=1 Tax=Oceanispirochaeta crateris TaxID=2518645 RepID=A0A5C1QJJ5_9SPIO|nr:OmpH family outer membrane protein [Oceanispirochaeta crateris]
MIFGAVRPYSTVAVREDKKLKKIITLIVLLSIAVIPVFSDTITKVAVLDYSRILSAFYKDSQAVRELEEMKSQFQQEIDKIQGEISILEERKLNAENSGNNSKALELDNQIFEKKKFMRDYIRVKNSQLTELNKNLSQNNSLVKEIIEEVKYVAESGGYSIVLKKSDPNLLWWNYEVDITEQVLQRLMTKMR